jgi:hypothetical protein
VPTLFGKLDNGVNTADEQGPQIVGASNATRQPKANTNDRDRFDATHI